jgi:hypothetical protein
LVPTSYDELQLVERLAVSAQDPVRHEELQGSPEQDIADQKVSSMLIRSHGLDFSMNYTMSFVPCGMYIQPACDIGEIVGAGFQLQAAVPSRPR